jgi:F-type H+-transporting ATPase subunit gamma
MSGSTQSLRKKIEGAGDLESVVRSMKALAASSIGQYEKAVQALDDYYRTVELALAVCLLRQAASSPPATDGAPRRATAIGAVIFGSDQGLVGRFNEVLLESALHTLAARPGRIAKIWAVGERIHALLAETDLPSPALLPVPGSVGGIAPLVGRILLEIETAREQGEISEVYLFHNHPKSGAVYAPISKRLLPLDQLWRDKLAALPWPTKLLPEVIEDAARALPAFIREYLFVLLFQACAESLASENASRLAAMQRADKNIGEILEELNRRFHRIRQESIDEELFDVISGYAALSEKTVKASAVAQPPTATAKL